MTTEDLKITRLESELAALREQLGQERLKRIQAEEALQRRQPLLTERIKEISCIYSIIRLMTDPGFETEEQRLKDITNIIPTGWLHSPDACVQIIVDDREYKTGNYRVTPWKLQAPLTVHGNPRGSLEVGYVRSQAIEDDGPFLQEEKALIDVIALLLGELIGMREAAKK